MRFHSQNLNENRRGEIIGAQVWHGRAWWYVGRYVLGWSWNFTGHPLFCHAYVAVNPDGEHTLGASIAVPFCALWVHLDTPWGSRLNNFCRRADQKYGNERRIGVSVHDWAFWWDVWADQMEWRHSDPRWQHGAWHPIDTLFGRNQVTWRDLETRDVVVPMPERPYPAVCKVRERIDRRPRWFARRSLEAWLDIPGGIPFPGKGENSWDCGMDGLFGIGGRSIENAIGRAVVSVLTSRERYAGSRDWRPEDSR